MVSSLEGEGMGEQEPSFFTALTPNPSRFAPITIAFPAIKSYPLRKAHGPH